MSRAYNSGVFRRVKITKPPPVPYRNRLIAALISRLSPREPEECAEFHEAGGAIVITADGKAFLVR